MLESNRHPIFAATAMLFLSAVTPGYAADCQTKFATAMSKIITSGPMRWTTKSTMNGKPFVERTVDFVPPTDTRDVTRSLIQGDEFIKQKATLERVIGQALDANGLAEAYTFIGADAYVGIRKDKTSDPDRLTKKPGELVEFYQFSRADQTYFTTSCSANKIDFEFKVYGAAKDPDAEADKLRGFVRPAAMGFVELDASGRPVRLVRGDYFPGPTRLEEVNKSTPGTRYPVVTSKSVEMTFTYDPRLTINAPK
jgi:hypothetical protein